MLIIVNPYATTVSDRLKNLVVYALQGRYEVETVATEAQNHATEIGREVRDDGYDVVVAFGGDGTLNEVANGLAGTDVPVSVLPGGSTNVVCRTLGIPNDVVDATEHLLSLADDWAPRKIDLGRVDGRHFVFSCGVGHRRHRGQAGRRPPAAEVPRRPLLLHLGGDLGLLPRVPGQPGPAAGRGRRRDDRGDHRAGPELRPLHLLRQPPGPRLRGGRDRRRHALAGGAEARRPARHADPDPAPVQRDASRPPRHRQIEHFDGVTAASITSISETRDGIARPFPVQVDGDYIGERTHMDRARSSPAPSPSSPDGADGRLLQPRSDRRPVECCDEPPRRFLDQAAVTRHAADPSASRDPRRTCPAKRRPTRKPPAEPDVTSRSGERAAASSSIEAEPGSRIGDLTTRRDPRSRQREPRSRPSLPGPGPDADPLALVPALAAQASRAVDSGRVAGSRGCAASIAGDSAPTRVSRARDAARCVVNEPGDPARLVGSPSNRDAIAGRSTYERSEDDEGGGRRAASSVAGPGDPIERRPSRIRRLGLLAAQVARS